MWDEVIIYFLGFCLEAWSLLWSTKLKIKFHTMPKYEALLDKIVWESFYTLIKQYGT